MPCPWAERSRKAIETGTARHRGTLPPCLAGLAFVVVALTFHRRFISRFLLFLGINSTVASCA
jgi:hypothetical protein